MRKFNKKGWKGNRSAVSEILGNILILGITVALFTSVMAFVSAIPEPPEPVSATFDAQLSSDILSVTHTGGSDLIYGNVMIVVTADGIQFSFMLSEGAFSVSDPSSLWKQGATWTLNLTENNLRFESSDDPYIPVSLHVAVRYITLPEYLWSKTLKTDEVLPIQITNFHILDEMGHTSNIIAVGSNFTVRMNVLSPSPDVQVQSGGVKVNLSSVYNNTASTVTLANVGGSLYSYTSTSPPSSGTGTYTVRISVEDSNGNTTQEFRQVRIITENNNQTTPVTPVDPSEPDGPANPGTNNTGMINDFYILTTSDWSSFSASDGTIAVPDTYGYNATDSFVIAFKGAGVQLPSNPNWGTGRWTYQWHIQFYNAEGGAISNDHEISGQVATLNGSVWYYRTISLEPAEQSSLNSKGLYGTSILEYRAGGKSYVDQMKAHFNIFTYANPGIYAKTYGAAGQNKSIFEIGDTITVKIYANDLNYFWDESSSSSFRVASFYNPSSDKNINASWAGNYSVYSGNQKPSADGEVFTFTVDTFELVGTYMSISSTFIYCENLVIHSPLGVSISIKVAVKVYLTEDHIVYSGNTIQSAINAASPGDTIRVFDGIYPEYLFISKNLTLWGNGTSVVLTPSSLTIVIQIVSDGTDIRGFSMNPSSWSTVNSVIDVSSADSVYLGNLAISTNNGRVSVITLTDSEDCHIENITMSSSIGKNGISIYDSSNITIANTTIYSGYNWNAILIQDSDNTTIIDCSINDGSTRIYVLSSINFSISSCSIAGGNYAALDLIDSHYASIQSNTFTDYSSGRIRLDNSLNVIIIGNTITGGLYQPWLIPSNPSGATIIGNNVNGVIYY
ncbi:MAG: right-handed parallel beta-helix repeat-containing protein [Candidatus Methanomethylophilaceae archaeon]|nr:right-handed parallel beta-helix repeat-containing protein [Candidatus Methanomethylophilaceae archaeon]